MFKRKKIENGVHIKAKNACPGNPKNHSQCNCTQEKRGHRYATASYESQIIDSQGAAWILSAYVLQFSAVL